MTTTLTSCSSLSDNVVVAKKRTKLGTAEAHKQKLSSFFLSRSTHKYPQIDSIKLSSITVHPLDSRMPRILSQESFPRRRNSSSFTNSRSSLGSSYGPMTPHKRNPLRANNFGIRSSKYSLTRMNKSSSTSLRHMVLTYSVCDNKNMSWPSSPSKQNAQWSNPPSLAGSDTSVQTDQSLSRTSSQLSLQHATDDRSDAMNRFCALQKSSTPSSGRAFLSQAYTHQDDTWGQFVYVADAEEELVRMSKFLSIRRHSDIPLMKSGQLDF